MNEEGEGEGWGRRGEEGGGNGSSGGREERVEVGHMQ